MNGRHKKGVFGTSYRKLVFVGLTVGGALILDVASARSQALDDAFEEYLTEVCQGDPPPGLEALCFAVNPPTDPPAFALISTGNLGGIASQEDASMSSATQERSARKRMRKDSKGRTDTSADFIGDRWGVYVAIQHSDVDRMDTALEAGYDAELDGGLIGLDYLALENVGIRLGATLAYTTNDTEFDNNGGSLEATSVSGVLHANYAPKPNFYGTIYFGYAIQDYDTRRNAALTGFIPVSGVARASFDGDQTIAGLSIGYDSYFDVSSVGSGSVGIFTNVNYAESDIDSYSEIGDAALIESGLAMSFEDQTARSLTTSVGLRGSIASELLGLVVPEARIAYVHEFYGESRDIKSSLQAVPGAQFLITTDPADKNYFRLRLGASARVLESFNFFAYYNRRLADSLLDVWSVGAGLRVDF